MKKILFVLLISLGVQLSFAQEKKDDTGWKRGGHLALLFSQNAFQNWTAGGENSIAGNLKINYDIDYKDAKNSWTNKFLVAYGATRINNLTKKTDDQLEWNSIYGRNMTKNWLFSYYLNFKTQLFTGYDYGTSPFAKVSNFLAPAFVSTGPGLLYKPSDNFYINFAPVTSKLVIVTDSDLNAVGAYGVDPGKSLRYELGMNYQMYFKLKLMENVTLENTLNLFSNYLDKPQNVDVDNLLNLHFKINKYLSAGLMLRSLYDDNTFPGWQISEAFGLEFGLDF